MMNSINNVFVLLLKIINKILFPLNITISRLRNIYPVEATKRDIQIIDYILRFDNPKEAISMVSVDRLWAVIQSTKYIVKNNIQGDFVECGVWRGGCSLAMAMVLDDLNSERRIFLFDTFEGMTKPTKHDVNWAGINASEKFNKLAKDTHNNWCYASIEDVKAQFNKIGLERYATFVKGDVLITLESINLPKQIALLRLDTDWYESTKHEMNTLYPKLQKDGVLLIDDYGHWQGSREAVDEYLEEKNLRYRCLIWKIDFSGRGLIKK